jgi:hypothetical protein
MSNIQKITNLKGVSYRVYIRRKGIKAITRTFYSKRQASQFVLKEMIGKKHPTKEQSLQEVDVLFVQETRLLT